MMDARKWGFPTVSKLAMSHSASCPLWGQAAYLLISTFEM